jgi:oligogalacturonide lyase
MPINATWPSESRTFTDAQTGRTIRQLTTTGNNVHFYFTDNSFCQRENLIYFLSDRAASEQRRAHDNAHYNLFRMDLASGEMTQITDEAKPVGRATKTPDSSLIAYVVGKQVKLLKPATGENWVIYEETEGMKLGMPSISADRRWVAVARNEPSAEHGANYSGFKERYYGIKDGRVTLIRSDGSEWFDAWRDTCQVAHVQFSPLDPTRIMFCHEGPWNLVTQRIWMLDLITRRVWPCFRQQEQDSIGHEFWTMDGQIFFDNRGPDHDGTITASRTQAVVTNPTHTSDFEPYVGILDSDGKLLRTIAMPFYCNHYHANPNNTLLVGDDVDELVLIDMHTEPAQLTVLCQHGTSWLSQQTHCHPTWNWDGKQVLYASDTSGLVQLYLLEP